MTKTEPHCLVDLLQFHAGTDKQVAAFLLVIAALMFLACYMDFVLTADAPTDDTARGYFTTFAFMLASAVLLIGAVFTLIVSYPETFKLQMEKIKAGTNAENFALIAALLYFIAFIAFYVWPCWAAGDGTLGIFWAIIYIAVVIVGSVIFGFLVFSSAGGNLGQNDGRGSNYVWQLCQWVYGLFGGTDEASCMECWSFEVIAFWESHLGSDVVIAWWGFLVVAFLTVPLTLYFLCLNYTNMFAYIYFMASIVFTLAVFGVLYTTYKDNWESIFVWEILVYLLIAMGIAVEAQEGEGEPLAMADDKA